MSCPWCGSERVADPDPDTLCDPHYAEYHGLTLEELERIDAYAEERVETDALI